jgi:hypothetical protein
VLQGGNIMEECTVSTFRDQFKPKDERSITVQMLVPTYQSTQCYNAEDQRRIPHFNQSVDEENGICFCNSVA